MLGSSRIHLDRQRLRSQISGYLTWAICSKLQTDGLHGKRLSNKEVCFPSDDNLRLQRLHGTKGLLSNADDASHDQQRGRCWSWKEVLDRPGVIANADICGSLLRWCGNAKALSHGKHVHGYIIQNEHDTNASLRKYLLQMYEQCGALKDALIMFANMKERDVFCANVIIGACARRKQGQDVLHLFNHMLQEGIMPNRVTFLYIFSAYAHQEALARGEQMHARIVDSQFECDVAVGTALVNMYGRCGNLDDARTVFGRLSQHNVISWTTMIAVHAQQGQGKEALKLFDAMQEEGISPNKITFVTTLAACISEVALVDGRRVHSLILDSGIAPDLIVDTALVNMYGKCSSLEDAWRIFLNMPMRNVVSWTAMITGCAQDGNAKEAFDLFYQMSEAAVLPNKVTYVSILDACASHARLKEGKQVHARMLNGHMECDVFVGTAIFNMYGKCGSLKEARIMFDQISERSVVSWNAMIALYTEHELGKEAIKLFAQMQQGEATPDKVTFINILATCTGLATEVGKQIHAIILDYGLEKDMVIRTALVKMYGMRGNVKDARMVFDKIPGRDAVLWNAMIEVYSDNGQGDDAFLLFDQMQREGVLPDDVTFVSVLQACASPNALADGKGIHTCIMYSGFESDVIVGTALVTMHGKCGSLEDARAVFDKLHQLNTVSWTTMIAVYAQHGDSEAALQTFKQMQQVGISPDRVTFVSVLAACSDQSALADGERLHAMILESRFKSDVVLSNALVNMYGKCGSVEKAWRMFDDMPKHDVVSWNAIIAVYAQHGHGKQALIHFDEMHQQGVLPDEITYTSVLVGCSRAGLIDEGCRCFTSMKNDYGIPILVDHYACIIDLLGRAGRLDEAEKLINDMPFRPTVAAYMALLGACRYKLDVERGECAAKHVFELDPQSASPYIMLSNIYATAGRSDDAEQLMSRMRDKGLLGSDAGAREIVDRLFEVGLWHLNRGDGVPSHQAAEDGQWFSLCASMS